MYKVFKLLIFYATLSLMKQYIKLLNEEPILKRLSTIQLIAYFGAWFSNVAIYTLLIEMNVASETIAFVAMLHFVAGVFQAPFSGAIIDRISPKKLLLTLISIEIVATFFLIFINNIDELIYLYALIFVKMAAASFYFTAEMSLLPKIIDGSKLQKANEMHSMIWGFSYTLGMALSGIVVYYFGIKIAFLLDTLMFITAFYLLKTLKLDLEPIDSGENFLEMMFDTFRYLKKHPQAMHLMLAHAFIGLTAFDAIVALMVDKYYGDLIAISLAIGLIHSSRAIGLVVGPILLSKLAKLKYIAYIFIFQAIAVWIWASTIENFYLSLVASFIVGLFTTTLWSYTYTLLQHNIDERYYGRITAYNDMLFLGSCALTSFMIGVFSSNSFELNSILYLMGVGFILGAIYFKWIVKTQDIKEIS